MKRLGLVSVVSVSFLALAGCSSDTGVPEADADEVSSIESALESNSGGFEAKDEAPDFADDEVSQLVGFEPRFADGTNFLAQAPVAARTSARLRASLSAQSPDKQPGTGLKLPLPSLSSTSPFPASMAPVSTCWP